MPSGPRIRANNVYGITSDNPLTAVSTSYNSVSLPLLPTISAAHAIVVLDPKRVFGDPEIVVVTAHAAASTVATIVRGQYGTSPRLHPVGTAWAHVPVDEDYIEILTSTTRPSDPYIGQVIYETDTNRWSARSSSGTWLPAPHNVPMVKAYNSVDLPCLNAAATLLTFNSEFYDTDNMHDTAVLNSRLTVQTAGVYLVQVSGAFQADTDYTRRIVDILLNATTIVARQSWEFTVNVTSGEGFTLSVPVKLIVGDFLTASVFQQNTSAGTNNVGGLAAGNFISFAATWIGVG